MRTRLFIAGFALILIAALGTGSAWADGADDLELREQITSFVRDHSDGEISRVEMPSLSRFREAANNENVRVELASTGRASRPDRIPVSVSLWDDEASRLLKRGTVNVDVHGEREIVVASRSLRPGTRITRSDLLIESRPLSEIHADAVGDPESLIGQRLRRSVGRGALVQSGFVEQPPLIERGQRVPILVARGALRIEMVGVAQQEGHAGDWIRATNDRSNHSVIGRVGEDGALHVDH